MANAEVVRSWVEACRPKLPIQNPLWAFVHNNVLLQWEALPFRDAVRQAAALYRARPYETEAFFRRQLARGRIAPQALGAVLLAEWPADRPRPATAAAAVAAFLADPSCGDDVPPVALVPGPAAEHLVRYSVRDRPLQDWLVPLIASYLDQGLAPWPNPFAEEGLWACFVAAVEQTPASAFPWAAALRARLQRHRAAGRDLDAIVHCEVTEWAAAAQAADYCLQALFVLKGWSGMVHKLETEPEVAPGTAPRLSLREWLGIVLVSMHALDDRLRAQHPHHPAPVHAHGTAQLGRLQRWQEAYERTFLAQVLATLDRDRQQPLPQLEERAQALVCMDDREESLRRALERPGRGIATFGTVGFFGFDMNFLALGAGRATRQCPPVVAPSRTLRELPRDAAGTRWALHRSADRLQANLAMLLYYQSRSLLRGALVSVAAGLVSFLPLLFRLLLPGPVQRWRERLQRWLLPRPPTRIDVDGEGGYRPAEQAAILAGILRAAGLRQGFAPLVAVVGHGSTTVNNPLQKAYGCGACSGNHGAPNARLFAALANRPELRAALAVEHGIAVPSGTWFVPFLHDTTTDTVTLLDPDLVPLERATAVLDLHRELAAAARESAVERCVRLLPEEPPPASPAEAHERVLERGHDLAQPRPEYGHNRVALCIVGRRALTCRSHLDRRSFLVSYDPTQDPSGQVLREAVLGTVPVAVNIAMDYYFSRVDNDGFGCGSKLPLNVAGLLGVITGSKSDLRIGLARQQVELHEPMRVAVLLEASAEHVRQLVWGHARLQRLVEGGWMRLLRVDPDHGGIELWTGAAFVPWRQAWPEAAPLAPGAVAPVLDPTHDEVLEASW
ncbi:MAG: DUF2309 family protein [Planctomycetes bacterium]|nr:DUF2309 family protein [Planctomycetota bacterium]